MNSLRSVTAYYTSAARRALLSTLFVLMGGASSRAYSQAAKAPVHPLPPAAPRGSMGQPVPYSPSAVPNGQGGSQGGSSTNPNRVGHTPQHLSQWMEAHRNLPVPQQQSALEGEPGFRELKPQEQQRIRNQLARLNSLPPEQRQLAIARTEWMERLAPGQRQQVREAMAQVGGLPPERARAVGRAFRSLRDLPQGQRQAYLTSAQARADFNDQERGTLSNLLNVGPLIPPGNSSAPR